MILTDYMPENQLVDFQKIKPTVEIAYRQIIDSITEKTALPYVPNIYPVPFMIAKMYTVHGRMVRILFYSIAYPDIRNFEAFAIYPTLALIQRLPDCLIGIIGHEIAHIISLGGKVAITESELSSALKDRYQNAKLKEKKAQEAYGYFSEPTLSDIIRWDCMSMEKDIEEMVSNDVQIISQQSFDRMIFKEKLDEYHDFIKSKLAHLNL